MPKNNIISPVTRPEIEKLITEGGGGGSGTFKGDWDASTNTPLLVNGVGTNGFFYRVSVAGSVDFGAGSISFEINDHVAYSGAIWYKLDNSWIASEILTDGTFTPSATELSNNVSVKTNLERAAGRINTKEPIITPATTAEYYRGDKTFQTLDADAVPNTVNRQWLKESTNLNEKTTSIINNLGLYELRPTTGDAASGVKYAHLNDSLKAIINTGASIAPVIISDAPAGGVIGSAATTVDVNSIFLVNQTTSSQTRSLPTPTAPTLGQIVTVISNATASFVIHNTTIQAGRARSFVWTGSTWIAISETLTTQTITTNTTLAGWNRLILADASTGNIVITLPANSSAVANQKIQIKRIDSNVNNVVSVAFSGYTVDQSASPQYLYSQNDGIEITSDGTNAQITSTTKQSNTGSKSVLAGTMNVTQTTNITTSDHIKFDTVSQIIGNNITLDTSTPYTSAINVASIGRITCQPGNTYRLVGQLPYVAFSTSGGSMEYAWYNANTGARVGNIINHAALGAGTSDFRSGYSEAYVTPSVATRYELRFTSTGTLTQVGAGTIIPTFYAEQITSQVNVITSVDTLYARFTSNQVINSAGTDLTNFVTNGGNIPNASGVFTLTAGKTYAISANFYINNSVGATAGAYAVIKFVDSLNNPIDVSGGSAMIMPLTVAGASYAAQPTIQLLYTPSANINVKFRLTALISMTSVTLGTGAGNNAETSVVIQQIGSTGTTSVNSNLVSQSDALTIVNTAVTSGVNQSVANGRFQGQINAINSTLSTVNSSVASINSNAGVNIDLSNGSPTYALNQDYWHIFGGGTLLGSQGSAFASIPYIGASANITIARQHAAIRMDMFWRHFVAYGTENDNGFDQISNSILQASGVGISCGSLSFSASTDIDGTSAGVTVPEFFVIPVCRTDTGIYCMFAGYVDSPTYNSNVGFRYLTFYTGGDVTSNSFPSFIAAGNWTSSPPSLYFMTSITPTPSASLIVPLTIKTAR